MITYSQNDQIHSEQSEPLLNFFEQSEPLLNFFEKVVKTPFEQHQRTEAWQREVLDSYKNRNFERIRSIVGRGQARFDEPFNGLTPEDRVLMYCYDSMQQHVVSQLYIFEKHKRFFNKYLFESSKKILFVDFGCGPLSSGIALAEHYLESQPNNREKINFNYIGIEQSNSMLMKAERISLESSLFHSGSTFNFFNPYDRNISPFNTTLFSCIDSYIDETALVILNFSYFFASSSLEVSKLIHFVQNILDEYQLTQICLIFQNPQGGSFNAKWNSFKNGVTEFQSVIEGEISEDIYYRKSLGGSNDIRLTRLRYDIRLR